MSGKGATRGDVMLLGRATAGLSLLARSGISNAEVAYDDDGFVMPVVWRAMGNWFGHRVYTNEYPYPSPAVEELLARTLNGDLCKRCERTTVVGVVIPGYCCFTLHAADVDDEESYRYVRSCETKAMP